MEHPPTLSWPGDFYLFLRLKSTFKGRRFYDATDIIKNATEELKGLSYVMVSKKASNTFTVADRSVWLYELNILKDI